VRAMSDNGQRKGKLIVVTGGARSGKSRFAEQYTAKEGSHWSEDRIAYIATSQVYDREMEERVTLHKQQRPSGWRTIEEPYDLEAVINRLSREKVCVVMIDCITLWLSNVLLLPDEQGNDQWDHADYVRSIQERAEKLSILLQKAPFTTIVVTNEVGDGLVPEYPLGRVYRDLAGWVNQALASKADEVYIVICGIPVNLRSIAVHLEG
jgi:adenosylcobinamide kinase/adenosylcobinamide-phosphate guanylyltransferase